MSVTFLTNEDKEELQKQISEQKESVSSYRWLKSGQMRSPVKDFQGWAHCIQYDKELGKAVGIVISGTGSHSNAAPLYRVTIDNNGYMSPYEKITFNYPETDKTEVGYIGSFLILENGTYWLCDYRQRIFTSTDKGYTWDFVTQLTLNGRNTYNNDFLFGVTVLENGRFIGGNGGNTAAETYYSNNGIDWTTVTMDVSQLGSQTYPEGRYIPFEPFIIDCGNGKVIQYARASMNAFNTYAEGNWSKKEGAVYSVSEDYGKTWTPWAWSKSITDMTANNGKVVVIGDVVHCVYGSRYIKYTDEYGNTPFFALRYAHTTLEKVLNDEWEKSIVIDVGHWDEATASLKADCGYPSIWNDENNNLYVVYYDSDESGLAYGANWRLLMANPYIQKKAVKDGGSGSKNVSYSQAQVDKMLKEQKTYLMEQIGELYTLIGQLPPDSGENDGSMYITDGLVDFWEPQNIEKWDTSGSIPVIVGSATSKQMRLLGHNFNVNIANCKIDETTGLFSGNVKTLEKFSTWCTDEFTYEVVFNTTDNSDGPLDIRDDTSMLSDVRQNNVSWDSSKFTLGSPFGTDGTSAYPFTKKLSHIAITGKDNCIAFWKNGVKINELTGDGLNPILEGYIGTKGFATRLADIRLYSKALSDDEIHNNYLYEQGRWTFGAVS